MRKKIIHAIITALIMAVFCSSCNSSVGKVGTSINTTSSNGLSYGSAEVWGASGATKVLQNVHGIYDEVRTAAEIKMIVARGEYEGAHIIMTAKDDFSYEVKTSDLKLSDGTAFSAANVEIFHELYIDVRANLENNGAPLGMYPDCLVPFENSKALGENVVMKGNNQGLYVRFNIGIDQKPGVYTGSFELKIGNESKNIPIELNVMDVEVSEESHSRSIFLVNWDHYMGELDATQNMQEKYVDALLKYRINPGLFMENANPTAEGYEKYAELMYEYTRNPKFRTIVLPVKGNFYGNGIDGTYLDLMLTTFFNKSIEKNYNLLELSYFYCVDEPGDHGQYTYAYNVCTQLNAQLKATADKLEADTTITSPMKDELIESMRNILNVVTNRYEEDYAEFVTCFCPIYSDYDTEYRRAKYEGMERWWYGAMLPRAPFPTFHIDDTLLSTRVQNWMKVQYGVIGELFWAVDYYSENGRGYPEDFYSGDASRGGPSNGDGFLFYPGKKYGVDGPLGTLRIEAIRDGLEEYEILHSIKDKYDEVEGAVSTETEYNSLFDTFISTLTEYLCQGIRISATEDTFYAAREELLQVAEISNSTAKMCILGASNDGYGTESFDFITKKGCVVKNKGKLITPVSINSEYDYYQVSVKCVDETNGANITVEKDGKTYNYVKDFGGKAIEYGGEKFAAGDFTKEAVNVTATAVNAETLEATYAGKTFMKLDVNAAVRDGAQSFRISNAAISGLNTDSRKVFLRFYNDGTSDINISLAAKFKTQAIYIDLSKMTLKPGMNQIELTPSTTWDNMGGIDYFITYIETNKKVEKTIYLADMFVYKR